VYIIGKATVLKIAICKDTKVAYMIRGWGCLCQSNIDYDCVETTTGSVRRITEKTAFNIDLDNYDVLEGTGMNKYLMALELSK